MEEITKDSQTDVILSLLNKITDDGKITEEEVNELRKYLLNEDGSYNINRKVADGLFNLLNTAKNKEVVDDSFGKLFIDAVSAYLLKDKSSTGVLDDKEVDWLVGKIESDLDIDDTVFALVQELKEKSYNKFPKKLDSAIILRRLRGIQRKLSESNNADERLFNGIVEQLKECVKERDKLFIDDKCIIVLFGIKDQLSRKKFLQLPDDRTEQIEQEKTGKTHTDEFIRVFCKLVSANVLYDENSPYDVDESEANKLKDIINHKTSVDYIDKVLLDELESRSMYFPEVLAKVRFGYETAKIRSTVVNALLKKKYAEQAKKALNKYLTEKFECRNEQEIKANLLFDLKNITKGKDYKDDKTIIETDIEYFEHFIQEKYIEQVTRYITGAESQSPNEIDNEEKEWLEERLTVSRSSYYRCDEDLLQKLKKSSVNFPHSLEEHLSRAIMTRILRELKDSNGTRDTNLIINELRGAIFDENDEFIIDPKETADYIFKIKDIIFKKDGNDCNEFLKTLFEDVVSKYLLEDKHSLGRIDKSEEEWLLAKIQSNGQLDIYDEKLLDKLEKRSINPPSVLHRIGTRKNKLGRILFKSRKISYFAVFGSLIASFVLFAIGAFHVVINAFSPNTVISLSDNVMVVNPVLYKSIKSDAGISSDDIRIRKVQLKKGKKSYKFWNVRLVAGVDCEDSRASEITMSVHNTKRILGDKHKEGSSKVDEICLCGIREGNGIIGLKSDASISVNSVFLARRNLVIMDKSSGNNTAFVEIIEAVDTFLVALVVFILGIGIYELFIRKLENPYKIREKRPSWMRISSVDDLKSSVVKVLLIAMIVGFYKKTLMEDIPNADLLYMAIGILVISAAFCLAEISAHYHNKSKNNDEK